MTGGLVVYGGWLQDGAACSMGTKTNITPYCICNVLCILSYVYGITRMTAYICILLLF